MMTLKSKRELLQIVRARYASSSRDEKARILGELVKNTGYNRKYAIHLLWHPREVVAKRKRRGVRRYGSEVQAVLVRVWQAANCICGKRLVAVMREYLEAMERHQELCVSRDIRSLLVEMSPATADRLLGEERRLHRPRGLTTTKPGPRLLHSIPIRTFAQWEDARPGFFEVDLVAHCGVTLAGEYLYTLVMIDIATRWVECVPLLNKGQRAVVNAIEVVRRRLPFPLLGIDSDCGSEFINGHLARYCRQHAITFTRSRPYKKNDQAHVEQTNWTLVRQIVGYSRYQGPHACEQMENLYRLLRPYVNFFQPVMKLASKRQLGSRCQKHYDVPMTPYRRILAMAAVTHDVARRMDQHYLSLNPAALLRDIHRLQETLWRLEQG
jgi:hypothetical protein